METYVSDAKKIWKDFKLRSKTTDFKALTTDQQLDFYQKNYHQFTMNFPLVLRYMIQMNQFNSKAFTRYVTKMQSNPYRSEEEYCERQANYVKFLYMELSNTRNMKSAQKVWQEAKDMLMDEVKVFKDTEKKIKEKLEKNKKKSSMEKRKELKRLLNQLK